MLHVLTLKEDINASVNRATKEILIMVSARPLNVAVHLIVNVAQMKNVFNRASVFVRRRSSSTPAMSAEIHVKGLHVESTRNVVPPIRLSACVKLVSKAIHCLVASALTNVPMHLAHMELSVSIKKVATSASVLRECQVIRIRVVVSSKIHNLADQHVNQTMTAHQIFTAVMERVLVHALICCVDRMPSVNLKIMLDGVDVELDISTARVDLIVFQVRLIIIFI